VGVGKNDHTHEGYKCFVLEVSNDTENVLDDLFC